jgi:hypothetical protein
MIIARDYPKYQSICVHTDKSKTVTIQTSILPTEEQLAERFSASRQTIRQCVVLWCTRPDYETAGSGTRGGCSRISRAAETSRHRHV